MARDVKNEYDVLVIGGGIYGAAIAWNAASRGLDVAVVDKGDFAGATSGNSLKIIHGGLRYLQQLDVKRMRESISERKKLLQIAPHLVHPLPCLMPTWGWGMKGKPVLALGLLANDFISMDRNRGMDTEKHLPNGKILSKQQIEQQLPFLPKNYTGAALWTDAQVYNSERLVLDYIKSARNAGATALNYARVVSFLRQDRTITGARISDLIGGRAMDIRAKMTVTAAGPWTNSLLDLTGGPFQRFIPSKAMNVIFNRCISPDYAFAVSSAVEYRNGKRYPRQKSRQLFFTPWRGVTIVGTSHLPYCGQVEDFRITKSDIHDFILELNELLPDVGFSESDVSFFHGGVLPLANPPQNGKDVDLLKHYQIVDHSKKMGLAGLLSVVGVKYTTARDVASKVVDRITPGLGVHAANKGPSNVAGGDIKKLSNCIRQAEQNKPDGMKSETVRQLVFNYGSEYNKIFRLVEENPQMGELLNSSVIAAQVLFAVREEMAIKLADVVIRRTELGSARCPDDAVLEKCARLMALELKWSAERIQAEIKEVKDLYRAADTVNQNKN